MSCLNVIQWPASHGCTGEKNNKQRGKSKSKILIFSIFDIGAGDMDIHIANN